MFTSKIFKNIMFTLIRFVILCFAWIPAFAGWTALTVKCFLQSRPYRAFAGWTALTVKCFLQSRPYRAFAGWTALTSKLKTEKYKNTTLYLFVILFFLTGSPYVFSGTVSEQPPKPSLKEEAGKKWMMDFTDSKEIKKGLSYKKNTISKTNPDISVNVLLLGSKSFESESDHREYHSEVGHLQGGTPKNTNEPAGGHSHTSHHDKVSSNYFEFEGLPNESRHHEASDGLSIQELELRFTSNIDAYFRGDIVLALEQHHGEFNIEPEEAFVETLFIPSLTVRVGKFLAFLNRHNQLHTHYFPFVDDPFANKEVLGTPHGGLSGTGVALAYLAPTPWYLEAVLQGFTSTNSQVLFQNKDYQLTGVLFVKNLWDITDHSTLELNCNYGTGENPHGKQDHLYGASVTYKWRPTLSRSVSWTSEWLQSDRILESDKSNTKGALSSWVEWQFTNNWRLKGRVELGSIDNSWAFEDGQQKYSLLLGFYPTEYSALRVQYDNMMNKNQGPTHRVSLQLNVSLGTHPAHLY